MTTIDQIDMEIGTAKSNTIFWDAKIKDLRNSGITNSEVLTTYRMQRGLNANRARKLARSRRFCS